MIGTSERARLIVGATDELDRQGLLFTAAR
jgi:hypothetical protein